MPASATLISHCSRDVVYQVVSTYRDRPCSGRQRRGAGQPCQHLHRSSRDPDYRKRLVRIQRLFAKTCLSRGINDVRSRVAANGPAIRPVILTEESVLLLETEPGLTLGVGLHDLGALMAEVVLVGSAVGVPALGEDDDVG